MIWLLVICLCSVTLSQSNSILLEALKTGLTNRGAIPQRLPPMVQNAKNLSALRRIRPGGKKALGSWNSVFESIKKSGHTWCPVTRDNHACTGNVYETVLSKVAPFNDHEYGLQTFPANSRILGLGNSHLLELLYPLICNRNSIGYTGEANDFIVHLNETGTFLLLLDNDLSLEDPHVVHEFLRVANFSPTHIAVGLYNDHRDTFTEVSASMRQMYPEAVVVDSFHFEGKMINLNDIGDSCPADFLNCHGQEWRHQCYPGPIVRRSEALIRMLLE